MSTATSNFVDPHAETLKTLSSVFGEGVFSQSRFRDNLRLFVPPSRLIELLTALKTRCGFGLLAELGGADYLGYPGRTRSRFEVHYVLRNLETAEMIVVKAGVDDPDPTLPSAVPLWPGADWMEREVFDMFGVRFAGHPDLRRILMPDEFVAYPLRKDYPLRGRGERHNFPKLTRGES
ncbi:NADH-quinone oxidoreductase subunit C [Paludisphaera borealis]|uniref:NADH-quinone oxidoreductase subunit C n=1 Tax=Paludisphaera borealis TaxID=1387353 RepID=A0A1U7CLF7_9BACT|nr:NADH-quinone oxidoreductase subunit C [Paludisphaera borealis]APW59759.1 NADH-quinone oxidoreductase subunit 5 [Paludisphaera borealis]MDR3623251.1 NADH-quinone oxidoreductase subunit C [Paludisphaera borealis]